MEEIKTPAETENTAPAPTSTPDPNPNARVSKLATASMVLGIISLCLFIICIGYLTALPAIILGIVGLVKINESRGMLLGKGRALAGIILGGSTVLLPPMVSIIAAIAIPNLLAGRMSANEMSAVAGLKVLITAEVTWRQQDADGNGQMDFWTYDVSCLNRTLLGDGLTKCEFIPPDLAKADVAPTQNNLFAPRFSFVSAPKSGYLFRAMVYDENNEPYNKELVNGIPAANKTKFAFVAYPATYGTTGVRTFIVNQEGTVYAADCGSEDNKVILTWPGADPCAIPSPSGRNWAVAD